MNNEIPVYTYAEFSRDFITLFQGIYEKKVLDIMNISKEVFPSKYEFVEEQSHGECDYVDVLSGKKYDAKLPFSSKQIELLTDGRKHKPKIQDWIISLQKEASEFDLGKIRNGTFSIEKTELFKIMRERIEKDKPDENIIFFFPYPISLSIKDSVFLQFATDYLREIYNKLSENSVLARRKIYAIYPTNEKSLFAVRDLSDYNTEYIEYTGLYRFFSYETTLCKTN